MGEKLIKPIIHIPSGCCPKCLSNLTIYESEILELELDNDGIPERFESIYSRDYGKCKNCGLEFDVVKNGMGFKPKSRLLDILDEEYLKYLAKDSNPFVK